MIFITFGETLKYNTTSAVQADYLLLIRYPCKTVAHQFRELLLHPLSHYPPLLLWQRLSNTFHDRKSLVETRID